MSKHIHIWVQAKYWKYPVEQMFEIHEIFRCRCKKMKIKASKGPIPVLTVNWSMK